MHAQETITQEGQRRGSSDGRPAPGSANLVLLPSLTLSLRGGLERTADLAMSVLLLSSVILFAIFVSGIRPRLDPRKNPFSAGDSTTLVFSAINASSYLVNRSQLSPVGGEIPIMPPLIAIAAQLSPDKRCQTALRSLLGLLRNSEARPSTIWLQYCGLASTQDGSFADKSAKAYMRRLPLDWPDFRIPREIALFPARQDLRIWYRNESCEDFHEWVRNQSSSELLSIDMIRTYMRPDGSILSESFQISNSNPPLVHYGSSQFSRHPFPSYPLLISLVLFVIQVIFGIWLKLKSRLSFRLFHVTLATFFVACAGFRLYISLARPVEQLVETLDVADPAYIQTVDQLFTWLDWHMFMYTLECWGILLSIICLFRGFAIKYMHFALLFPLVFVGITVIGWLSLGDLMGWTSVNDVLFVQFAMISSNWPRELEHAPRPVLFILWSGSVITVIYCMLYTFYQTLLEKEYQSTSWWGSSLMHLYRTRKLNRTTLLRRIRELEDKEQSTVPLSRLEQSVSRTDWSILEANGYISDSIVPDRSVPSSLHKLTDTHVGEQLQSVLAEVDSVTTWLCLNSRPIQPVRDEDLRKAIEESFRSVEQKLASTVIRPGRDKKLRLD